MSELSREYPLTLELPLAAINWTVNSNTADADIQATAHQTPQATAMKKINWDLFLFFYSVPLSHLSSEALFSFDMIRILDFLSHAPWLLNVYS